MTTRPAVSWVPQVTVGVAVFVVCTVLTVPQHRHDQLMLGLQVLLVLGYAVAAGLSRRRPGWSLGVAALTGLLQALTGAGLSIAQLALLVVVYGCARWGSTAVLWLGAAAVPLSAAIGAWGLSDLHVSSSDFVAGDSVAALLLTRAAYWHTGTLVVLGAVLLACSWISGLALRMRERAQLADAERVAAQHAGSIADETARLRAAQAELARDVHDVVGHSLAVILAQAEAARVLDDPERVRQMLGHIVDTTRSSLQDVRGVLTDTASPPGDLDDLVDRVAATRAVQRQSRGQVRPLPPDLQTVAHRVLQEMLTNALRHGTPDGLIGVEMRWQTEHLTLVVTNDAAVVDPPDGNGIPGMRRRLGEVGGFFHLHHDGTAAIATATMPLRAGSTT